MDNTNKKDIEKLCNDLLENVSEYCPETVTALLVVDAVNLIKKLTEPKNEKGILNLLEKVGEKNIRCQFIHQSMKSITMNKKGESTISFLTQEITPSTIDKKVGLIVWFDRNKLP